MPHVAKSSKTARAADLEAAANPEQLDPHVRLALATWPQIDPSV
jgi:hypothetical protein